MSAGVVLYEPPSGGDSNAAPAATPASQAPAAAGAPPVSLSPSQLMELYQQKKYNELAELFLTTLNHFKTNTYRGVDAKMKYFINVFIKHFLFYMSQEDFVPSDKHLGRLIDLNVTICNLVAISDFRNTDAHIEILSAQKRNFAKILALYNPRNKIRINRERLFNTNPTLSSQWYFAFLENYKACCVAQNNWEHMRMHLDYVDKRLWAVNSFVHHGYFGATYVNYQGDHVLKARVNEVFQQWGPARQKVVNTPDPKRIAVLTSMWFPRQSVYRCMHKFVETLSQDYSLTLVHLGPERKDLDSDLFDDVRHFNISKSPLDLSAVLENDFGLAFFPDIGMNIESIFLSNLRLAPVQICGYGHPVSTRGSKVDYWLGGLDTESIAAAEENYSERLVLIPGAGVQPNKPDYVFNNNYVPKADSFNINCAWTGQKINFPHLSLLRRIIESTDKKLVFHFFPGGAVHSNGYIPLRRDIQEVLGAENCNVHRDLQYPEYMAVMEQGDFSIDSFPFGGYATATDALYLRKPIVTKEERKFYNRSAASLLRAIGVADLIVETDEEYVALILRLIEDPAYLKSITARIEKVDLDATIFKYDASAYFKQAIDHLVDKHEALRQDDDRRPLIFDAEGPRVAAA